MSDYDNLIDDFNYEVEKNPIISSGLKNDLTQIFMDFNKVSVGVFLTMVVIICGIKDSWSQRDSVLNEFNDKGAKHGYWINYLDSSFNLVDSTQSSFYYYAYYNNGVCWNIAENPKLSSFELQKHIYNKGLNGLELLDGIYTFTNYKRKWTVSIKFRKGYLETWYFRWDDKGEDWEKIDWTKKYNGLEASNYRERQLYKGRIKKGYCYSYPDSKKVICNLKNYKIKD